jgi:hypothetical protein
MEARKIMNTEKEMEKEATNIRDGQQIRKKAKEWEWNRAKQQKQQTRPKTN